MIEDLFDVLPVLSVHSRPLRERPQQPHASGSPLAVDGTQRHAEDLGDLLEGQTDEESQFDDTALAWIDPREILQGIVEIDEGRMPNLAQARTLQRLLKSQQVPIGSRLVTVKMAG